MLGMDMKRMAGGTDRFSVSDWRQDGDVFRGSGRYHDGVVCSEGLRMRNATARAFSDRMEHVNYSEAPNGHIRERHGWVQRCGEVPCPDGYCKRQFDGYNERGEPCYGSYGEHFGDGLFYGDYGGVETPARYANTVPHLAPAMPVGAIALYTGTEVRNSRLQYGASDLPRARYGNMVPRSELATPYGAIAVYTGTESRSSMGTYRASACPMFSGGEYDCSTVQVGNAVMDPAVAAIIRDGTDFGHGPVCSVAGWDGLCGVGGAAGVDCSVADRNGVSEPVSGDVNGNAAGYEADCAAVERLMLEQRMTVESKVATRGTDLEERYGAAKYSAPCVDTSSCETDVWSVDSGNDDGCYGVPNGPADGISASANNGGEQLDDSAEMKWSVPMDDALVELVCGESVPQLSVGASYGVSGCSVAYPDGSARSGATPVQSDSVPAENVMLGLERCSDDDKALCDSRLEFERSKNPGSGADVVTEAVPSVLPERCDDTESVISFGDFGGSDAVANGDLRVAGVSKTVSEMVPRNTEHGDCLEYFEVPFVREGDGGNCVAFESVDEGNAEVSLGGDCDSGHEAFGTDAVHHDTVTTKCSDGPETQWLQSSGTAMSVDLPDEACCEVLSGSVQELLRAVELERMLMAFPSVMHAWLGSGALTCERSVDSGSRMNGEGLRFGVIVPDEAEDDASVTGGSVRETVRDTSGDGIDLTCDGNMSECGDGERIDSVESALCYCEYVPCQVIDSEATMLDLSRRTEVPVGDCVLETRVCVPDRCGTDFALFWSVLSWSDSTKSVIRDEVCMERTVWRDWDPGGPDGALLMARSVSNGTHCVHWSLGKSGSTTEPSFGALRDSTLPSVSVPDWREVVVKLCLASNEVELDATTSLDGGTRIPDSISVVWNREHVLWHSLRVGGLVCGRISSCVRGDTVAKPREVIVCDACAGGWPIVLDGNNASARCGSERLCLLDHGPFRSMTLEMCSGMGGKLEAELRTECHVRTDSFSALVRKCSWWLDSPLQPEDAGSVPGSKEVCSTWTERLHQYLSVIQCHGVCATVVSLEGGGLRLVGEPSPAPRQKRSVIVSLRAVKTTVTANVMDNNRSEVLKTAWRTDADREVGARGLHC